MALINEGTGLELTRSSTGDTSKTMLYRRFLPNAPEYLSTAGSCRRTTVKATSAGRRQEEADAMQQLEETFMAEDDIADVSIADTADSLQREATTPQGFTISVIDQTLFSDSDSDK